MAQKKDFDVLKEEDYLYRTPWRMTDSALIFIIPDFIEIKQDQELGKRFREDHRRHIRENPTIFAQFRDVGSLARLLFLRSPMG